jgi:hypothetical protein
MHLRLARPAVLLGAALAYAAAMLMAVSFGVAAPASADETPAGGSGAAPVPGSAAAPAGASSGDARYYRTSVLAVEPAAPGLTVTVADGGAVTLENRTGKEVVVLGYAGEPYLQFPGYGMVLRNRSSLTTALVAGRTPGQTSTGAGKPLIDWEHLSHEARFTWKDVRVQWSSAQRPPVVEQDEHAAHRVLDWALDVTVDGRPTIVRGAVDWTGTPAVSRDELVSWAAVGVALVATVCGLVLVRLRRRRRPSGRRGTRGDAGTPAAGTPAAVRTAEQPAPELVLSAQGTRPPGGTRSPYADRPDAGQPYAQQPYAQQQQPYAEVLGDPAPSRRSRRAR